MDLRESSRSRRSSRTSFFKIGFSRLHQNIFQRGCESISERKCNCSKLSYRDVEPSCNVKEEKLTKETVTIETNAKPYATSQDLGLCKISFVYYSLNVKLNSKPGDDSVLGFW